MGNLTVVARILQDTIDTSGKSDRKMNYQNSIHVCLTFKSYSALNCTFPSTQLLLYAARMALRTNGCLMIV